MVAIYFASGCHPSEVDKWIPNWDQILETKEKGVVSSPPLLLMKRQPSGRP